MTARRSRCNVAEYLDYGSITSRGRGTPRQTLLSEMPAEAVADRVSMLTTQEKEKIAAKKSRKNTRRLAGGTHLTPEVHAWWMATGERVAEAEGLGHISTPALLTRIANYDLELTIVMLERYARLKRKSTNGFQRPKKFPS